MKIFQRYLSLFVAAAIIGGVAFGEILPTAAEALAGMEFYGINLPVAALIWLMIFPMMLTIDLGKIREFKAAPKGLVLTLIVNWAIKPFTMAAIAGLFFYWLYAEFISPEQADALYAGAVLLGVAPCTAMVFVWSKLTKGDALYTLVQVVVNDLLILVLFVPIAGLLLGLADISIPYPTLILSIVIFVLVPLVVAQLIRYMPKGNTLSGKLSNSLSPIGEAALVLTVFLIFSFQSDQILSHPLMILLIAIPLLIQTYFIFILQYMASKKLSIPHPITAPSCMIGASNFFELAVVVAIALFGVKSLAATATITGVLVEVPVMLSLVAFLNKRRAGG